MKLVVTSPPEEEPVDSEEAKQHAVIEHDQHDGMVDSLIVAARQMVESYTETAVLTQTRTLYLDKFPGGDTFSLCVRPVQSVVSIKYYDANDALQTWATDNYWVDDKAFIPAVRAVNGWPTTKDKPNVVEIEMICGHLKDECPEHIRTAIKMLVAHYYENRSNTAPLQLYKVPGGVESLLSTERIHIL